MSTDLVAIQNQLPDNIKAMLAQQMIEDIGRLGSAGGKDMIRITQDKKFVLPDDTQLEELEVAIVNFVYRNEYYLGNFNKKSIQPPACFAISPSASDITPSDNSPLKQSDAGCATCQQNQFGSSPNGDGKACKNTVFLAVLPLDATSETPIWALKISPTAVKAFNTYAKKVAAAAKVPVTALATKLSFDPELTYASVRFEAIGTNPVFEVTNSRREEAMMRLKQEPDLSGFEMPTK